MNNDERLLQIIKELNDYRSKLSALYSLYNSALIGAEDSRIELGCNYEKMIDLKNNLSLISNAVFAAKKTERSKTVTQKKSEIKKINVDAKQLHTSFKEISSKYKIALKDCGSLKTQYKHEVSELCKEFTSLVNDETEAIVVKGCKQQVKIIKAILVKIELLISDYNVKKNKVQDDNQKFTQLYESVNGLIDQLQTIA